MSKYVFIYHAPTPSADAPQPSAEEMAKVTSAWMGWAGQVGDRMVDFGTPLAGGVSVTPAARRPAPARSPATRSSRPTPWTTRSRSPRTTRT